MTEVVTGPLRVITELVQDFQSGQRDQASFLDGLNIVEHHLQAWSVGIDQLPVPDNYLEGLELQELCQQGLGLLAQAVAVLRDCDQDSLETGLCWAQEGHDILGELIQVSLQNVIRLEEDL